MKLEKEDTLYDYGYSLLDFNRGFTDDEKNILEKMRHKKVKLTLEYQEPILDEEERKYLSDVIKPFKNEIECIIKKKSIDYKNKEYIVIHFEQWRTMPFPHFEKGTMYNNMTLNKEYTIQELGLWN